jgi:hypothetical protein
VVATRSGYVRLCVDGPVIDAAELAAVEPATAELVAAELGPPRPAVAP